MILSYLGFKYTPVRCLLYFVAPYLTYLLCAHSQLGNPAAKPRPLIRWGPEPRWKSERRNPQKWIDRTIRRYLAYLLAGTLNVTYIYENLPHTTFSFCCEFINVRILSIGAHHEASLEMRRGCSRGSGSVNVKLRRRN